MQNKEIPKERNVYVYMCAQKREKPVNYLRETVGLSGGSAGSGAGSAAGSAVTDSKLPTSVVNCLVGINLVNKSACISPVGIHLSATKPALTHSRTKW